MVPRKAQASLAVLRRLMVDVWPDLATTKITHSWTGNTGFSHGLLPHVGEIDGVTVAMGYCGSGVAMAPYLGAKAAYQMLGEEAGETAFARTQFRRSWLQPTSKPHFLAAANVYYRQIVDRKETLRQRNS